MILDPFEKTTPRHFQQPAKAWLFDIDGVLTDPELKVINKQEILIELVKRLERGEPIGGNTGRSLKFAEDRFLRPLEAILDNRTMLNRVIVVGDKGGAWLVHGRRGRRTRFVDESMVTEQLKRLLEDVTQLVLDGYAEIAFVDLTKQTMVTIEMKDGVKVAAFRAIQAELVTKLWNLLRSLGFGAEWKVDATRIAIDIEHIRAGKALGARRFKEILHSKGIEPQHFVTFGDSPSDYDMAEELHRLGLSVEFVFVGEREEFREKNVCGVPIVYTRGHCDIGTLEYLTQDGS